MASVDGHRDGARLRAAAAKLVDEVVGKGRSLDAALPDHEADVAPDDRSLLRLLCYGTIRQHFRIREWLTVLLERPLAKRDRVVEALLAVGLFQLTDTRIPDHAAVAASVEAARRLGRGKLAGLVNAVLRRFLREDLAAAPAAGDEARFNHPRWLITAIAADWPGDWQDILRANDERAPMWLRVNARRNDRAAYLDRLDAAGIEAETQPGLAQAVRLLSPCPVTSLPGFAAGDVSVQDGAAQLAAPWLLDSIRGRVLDACAAPGGKSAHLLELGGDDIDLTCIDIDAGRAAAIRDNLARLGLNATVSVGDASTPDGEVTPLDGILLDAPCSASGVIRRHPDVKLLRRKTDIGELAGLQRRLLDALWPRLRPGGRLLYVTCSVLAAENEATVAAFLERRPDAREIDVLHNNNIRDLMRRRPCGYQILPGTAGMDGFYYACLEKVS